MLLLLLASTAARTPSTSSSEIDHVAAADDAELGAGHADGGHAVESGLEIVRGKLVGDGGDAECTHSGSGFPLVSGMNGTVASPIRNTRHIVTPA